MTHGFCRVALDSPVFALDRPFDYRIPERMAGRLGVGSVVRVRMHGRRMRAYVTELLSEPEVARPAVVSELVSEEPLFTAREIELARWTARRYVATLGGVLHHATPGRFSAPTADTDEQPATWPRPSPPDWLPDAGKLGALVRGGGGAVVGLPDGRAEAELVAWAATSVARRGRGVLVLTPRVAVCEALAGRIAGARMLHGDLKPAKRAAAWAASRDGAARILVGTRAAVFAPVRDLGLVWVAAAHDRAYKEERTPRLHALVVARERARSAEAAFGASSPAPPLELVTARDLAAIRSKPNPLVRPEIVRPTGGPATPRLIEAVQQTVARGADALVFSGRRGFSLRLRCRDCGWYPACPDCDSALQPSGDRLRCRLCGRTESAPDVCGACTGTNLDGAGWGDERVAAALAAAEVGAPVLRVDASTPLPERPPHPVVIVGTQTAVWSVREAGLVAVADLDQLLGLPDFRAAEHAYQLLWELASLVSPGGRCIVQTREADHHVVQAFTRRSFRYFAERELARRRAAGYPPYGTLVHLDIARGDMELVLQMAGEAGARAVGPLPRPGGRAAVLVRGDDLEPLLEPLRALAVTRPDVRIDVDPVDVL